MNTEVDPTSPRRQALKVLAGAAAMLAFGTRRAHTSPAPFRLRHILGSCMYGTTKLAEIVPEVRKSGATHIDIWPRVHGDQREQMEAMGHERFAELLSEHGVKLGMLTHYDLGPFRLQKEMAVAKKLGGTLLIAGSAGPKNLAGKKLKEAVRSFAERLQPHVAAAAKHELTIGIENHGGALINSPDSLRWFVDMAKSKHVGIAMAPYHLPQDEQLLAKLIDDLGPRLVHFYAWQKGMGCHKKLPKEQELLQMPGRGKLDFRPLLSALKRSGYAGWTEIFMHPVPRGIPILEKTAKTTDEINRARRYLEKCLAETS